MPTTKATSGQPAGNALPATQAGLGSAPGQRIPVPPRERKPALAALAVLLILGGALMAAYLVIASGNRVSAIQISRPVAAGQQIPPAAMREVQIANTGINYVSWSEHDEVTQAYAAVPLVEGTLLTNGMMSQAGDAIAGKVIVGLALKPGQMPPVDELTSGVRVSVYAVTAQGGQGGIQAGTILAEEAIVRTVVRPGENDIQSDQIELSIAVPPGQAPQLAQAASAGAVAVALLPPGTQLGGGAQSNGGGAQPNGGGQLGTGNQSTGEPGNGDPGRPDGTG